MKFLVVFVMCLIAMATAAPQFIYPYNGLVDSLASQTVIAGPTVVNRGLAGFGAGLVAPGFADFLCDNC